MPHPAEHTPASAPLSADEAAGIAQSMSVFSTPSRVRLLYALLEEPRTVEELAAATGLEGSAASHQLRTLRQLAFVVAEREGRHIRYRVHNHHIADLLSAVRHHHEHAAHGWAETPQALKTAESGA
jgi:DNA-binding transcriptional ArsR family regulator